MANICPDCQKEFYSDTEFHEHQNMEMLRKFITGGISANKELGAAINRLASVILQQALWNLMEKNHISMEEAATLWFDNEQISNRRLTEQYNKWKEQQTL